MSKPVSLRCDYWSLTMKLPLVLFRRSLKSAPHCWKLPAPGARTGTAEDVRQLQVSSSAQLMKSAGQKRRASFYANSLTGCRGNQNKHADLSLRSLLLTGEKLRHGSAWIIKKAVNIWWSSSSTCMPAVLISKGFIVATSGGFPHRS